MRMPSTRFFVLGVLIAAALTIAVYWEGLAGGYVHDDFSFIVNNGDVHVDTLDLGDWVRAAQAFPARHQGRWLTMLSFAANYSLTGLDPFWMKATNLAIHLVNGALLFFVLQALFALRARVREGVAAVDPHDQIIALVIAMCWLLLPINLTGVLYVSQRLESLSQVFVLLGLWLYLRGRLCMLAGECTAAAIAIPLVLCTAVGLLAKESAVLLPVYTACIELVIVGLRDRSGAWRRNVIVLYGVLLLVPLIAGLAWLSSWVGGASTYARPFTTGERLLTEARVLADYIQWTLLPFSKQLTLYHDDIALSRGLLSPPSTLPALLGLAALLVAAIAERRRRPLFCLGILWFFSAHLLTATVIPLELAYEHRNYFASIGLLIAAASLLATDPLPAIRPRLAAFIAAAAIVFFAFTTSLRVLEWRHPVSLAYAEAQKRPDSEAALYELGRTLMIAAGEDNHSRLLDRANEIFVDCMALKSTNILCEQGLVILQAKRGIPIDRKLWTSIVAKLRAYPASEGSASSLMNLWDCQAHDVCPKQYAELREAFEAAMHRTPVNPRLLANYGDFAAEGLGDFDLAERLLRQAVLQMPYTPVYRFNLIQVLLHNGKPADVSAEMAQLSAQNHFGSLSDLIAELDKEVAAEPAPAAALAPPPPGGTPR
jgi:protein O-mannosyl-transferase